MTDAQSFWPNGARLAVSVSMQFEAGGQPISGAGGPITEAVLPGFPDLGQNSFYEYGAREGVPRILDLLDRHSIKMTSFMIGDAVRRHPDVAAEIVRRGHEAGAHGRSWQRQYQLPRPQETEWITDSVAAIEDTTGTRPTGYNNYWIRPGVNTLEILQDLGFRYHIDDLSADEPFLQTINGQPFATVPYSVHLNDIASFDFPGFSPADYETAHRRVRTALHRRRTTPPHDGHWTTRTAVRARLPGARTGPRPHETAGTRRPVVGTQRPNRTMGFRPPRHHPVGQPRPRPDQRTTRPQPIRGSRSSQCQPTSRRDRQSAANDNTRNAALIPATTTRVSRSTYWSPSGVWTTARRQSSGPASTSSANAPCRSRNSRQLSHRYRFLANSSLNTWAA